MARRRKRTACRGQERADAERRVWNHFRSRLESLNSFVEALRLVGETPPPDSPGRAYYSNLSFFLQNFTVPAGSSYEERELYLRFIQRLDAADALKSGAAQQIQDNLRRSMDAQESW